MKSYKLRWLSIVALVTLVLPALTTGAGYAQQPGCQTFKETGKTVCGRFMTYWSSHGGLAQQGFPISDEMQEKSETNGQVYSTQYFERAVFEYHPEEKPEFQVLLSLLGVFYYNQKYPKGATGQVPNNTAGSLAFKETGKRLGGIFLTYWKTHGSLAQQGFPISDEFNEVSDLNGKTYRVQYFERAVFEYHPEEKPEFQVLLSQLGTFRYRVVHGSGAGNGGEIKYPTGAGQITIWHSYTGPALDTLQKAIDGISSQNKDFKVNLVSVPADQMQSRFISAVAAGTGPDLMLGPSDWTGTLAEGRSILPADGVESVNSLVGELQPAAINASKYGGKLYGVPVNMETVALVYNKDVVKTLPTTLDDLLVQAGRLVGANNGAVKYGLALNADFFHTGGYNFAFGGRLFTNSDPNATNRQVDLTTQGTINWLSAMKRLRDSAGVLARTVGSTGPAWRIEAAPQADISQDMDSLFKSGAAAMVLTTPEAIKDFENTLGKNKIGVAAPPPTTAGGKYTPFVSTNNYFVGAGRNTSTNLKSIAEYLKYITSTGVQQTFVDQVGQLATSLKVSFNASPALAMLAEQASYARTVSYSDRTNLFAGSSNLGAFIEQANQGTPEPNVYHADQLTITADRMVADVVEGRVAPQQAANAATQAINRAITVPQGGTPTPTPPPTGNCASMRPGIWNGTVNGSGTFNTEGVAGDIVWAVGVRLNVLNDCTFTGTYNITNYTAHWSSGGVSVTCTTTGQEDISGGRITAGQGGLPRLTFSSRVTQWSSHCDFGDPNLIEDPTGTTFSSDAQASRASGDTVGGDDWFSGEITNAVQVWRESLGFQGSSKWDLRRQP